jgi:hypothetical protein
LEAGDIGPASACEVSEGNRVNLKCLVLALVALPACASRADLPSFVAPGFGERKFESVAVLANFSDLHVRGTFERLLDHDLRVRRRRVVQCSALLFPDRAYSHDETLDTVRGQGIQSLLVLDPVESGENRWIPLQIDELTATRSSSAGMADSEETRHRTVQVTTGREQWLRVRVRLIDLSTGRAVWLMDGTLRGPGLGTMENLAENIVDGLNETRVLGP